MNSKWLMAGAALAGLGVGAGAFGAHGLRPHVDAEMLAVFETGVRYQIYHSLALLIVGLCLGSTHHPNSASSAHLRSLAWAGRLFLAGIVLFSGSLYAMALTGERWLGAVTPLGGVSFLAGWIALTRAGFVAGKPKG